MKKTPTKVLLIIMTMTAFFTPPLLSWPGSLCTAAAAEEAWKRELIDICSRTDEAMSFSKEELKTLLQRGEKLKPVIEALEESPRKVYLKRLDMCIRLYSFVLESKEADRK